MHTLLEIVSIDLRLEEKLFKAVRKKKKREVKKRWQNTKENVINHSVKEQ